jgi:hypothetical protein
MKCTILVNLKQIDCVTMRSVHVLVFMIQICIHSVQCINVSDTSGTKVLCTLINKTYTECESKCNDSYLLHIEVLINGSRLSVCGDQNQTKFPTCGCANQTDDTNTDGCLPIIHDSLSYYHGLTLGQIYECECVKNEMNETTIILINKLLITDGGQDQDQESDSTKTILLWVFGILLTLLLICIYMIDPEAVCACFGVLGEIFECILDCL